MSNVGDLINATYRHLNATQRQEINQTAGIIGSADTSIQFTYDSSNIDKGDYLSIDDEIMYVWSANSGTKTAVVQRGMVGTKVTEHGAGILVERNPRFPRFYVRQALQDEIASWGERIYAIDTIPVKATRGHRAIPMNQLADDFLFGLELVRSPLPGHDAFIKIAHWTLQRGVKQSTYLNNIALTLTYEPECDWAGTFTYALPFNLETFKDNTNLETIIHLPPEFQDIPPMGAVARLMMGRDVLRTFTEAQGEPRDAAEVSVGQMTQIAMRFRAAADTRLTQVASRLLGQYPWRMR